MPIPRHKNSLYRAKHFTVNRDTKRHTLRAVHNRALYPITSRGAKHRIGILVHLLDLTDRRRLGPTDRTLRFGATNDWFRPITVIPFQTRCAYSMRLSDPTRADYRPRPTTSGNTRRLSDPRYVWLSNSLDTSYCAYVTGLCPEFGH